MQRAVYCVVAADDGWLIRLNDKGFGPCPTRDMAVATALRAAKRACAKGCYAHVMVHDGVAFRTVWLNGHDRTATAA